MEFLEQNWKPVAGVGVIALVVGLGIAWMSSHSLNKEKTAQESFAALETQYTQYKEDSAAKAAPTPTNPDEPKKAPVNVESLKKDLESFVSLNKGTSAAQMAALQLADLLLIESKPAEALAALKSVENTGSELTAILVQKKTGQVLADLKQCPEAVQVWDKILGNKKADFAYADVKISQALCYQNMNELKKAEDLLISLKNDKSEANQTSSKEAERILRLIQFNKVSGT